MDAASDEPDRAELADLTIAACARGFAAGALSSAALVDATLHRIADGNTTGPALRALIAVCESAPEIARERDAERAAGRVRGPLHGVPVVLKDNIATAFADTTAGSVTLSGWRPAHNAPLVDRIAAAGAVVVGKANLHEFSFGISTESSAGGATLNPFDLRRNPGGSSGGTAVAVAVGFAVAGIGTDTGGSVRFPAAHASLVGLRPTAGTVDGRGIVPISSLMDTAGPICRTVDDAALLHAAMTPTDAGPLAVPPPSALRLGVLRDRFGAIGAEAHTSAVVDAALARLAGAGAHLVDLSAARLDERAADTVGFEFRAAIEGWLADAVPRPAVTGIDALVADPRVEPKARARMARALALPFDERAFAAMRAQRVRVRDALQRMLAEHRLDALVYPSFRSPARTLGEEYWQGDNAMLASVSGMPAVSVPAGFAGSLPVGLELLGAHGDDRALLAAAAAVERVLAARRVPPGVREGWGLFTPA